MNRIVEPEILDALPPADSRALRSRRDLRRVNSWMGNHKIMANALKENCSSAPGQITELGAGDGNFLLRVAQEIKVGPSSGLSASGMNATLLDRQKIISSETLAAFQSIGWRTDILTADVFDWSKNENSAEIVIANLFLHHFEDARLAELLRKISRRAKLFVAVEPRRFAFPFLCGQLLWLIGCNRVTRHDAAASVRAGFSGDELSALWPKQNHWQLTEQDAGFFSHLFIAQKRAADILSTENSPAHKMSAAR
ncbi:MAG: class I SAM-dependent methyltransferase [Limisphaerales bacterium]